jgi:hypothetical protein
MFKELGIERGISEGNITPGAPAKSDLVSFPHHQPPGTKSEMIPYYNGIEKVAICHQYTLPDGTIGASGKPDPKMIRHKGRQYYTHSQPCKSFGCTVCRQPPEDWRAIV